MNKDGKSKLMPLLVTLILLGSMLFVITPTTVAQQIDEVSKTDDLTCGEEIWVNASDLTVDERYYIFIENETGGWELMDDQRADEDSEIAVNINVPYRNPLGAYFVGLSDSDDSADIFDTETLNIDNTFWVRYKVAGDFLDHVIYNQSYEDPDAFFIYVYNWTGSKYELVEEDVTIVLYDPDGVTDLYTKIVSVGYWDLDITFDKDDSGNFETNYLVDVELDPNQKSLAKLPVKLDVTATLPDDVEWGDTVTISGYVRDGEGDGIADYTVKLYSPGSWVEMDEAVTYSSGRFSLSAPTDDGSAGTWYIGTEQTGGSYRINETDKINITDFIKYFSFDVAPDDSARVELESPDEVISGFDQTLNVSVYNSWDDDEYYDEMWIHITGLECVFGGESYDEDDIITVHDNASDSLSNNEKYAFYEFDIKFNETGTATIIVTHPYNNTVYEDNDELVANITGTATFPVVSPDDMNIIVEDMPDTVLIEDGDGDRPPVDCDWINTSTMIKIFVYGDDQDEPMNATITIKGAGIDIEIEEDDEVADLDELVAKADGEYWVMVSPKKAGVVTITVDNDTENMTGSKDFSIKGLSGSVTTSIGDDLEMSVQSTEIITVNIANGQYAEVHLTYYDEDWDLLDCMNESIGENEPGNGLNGEFEFTVTDEDIEDGVGFIVVTAWAGADFFFYDIVEVAPIHDLVFEIIDPEDALNQTLTVGLEHEWEFKIMDEDGNLIDDIDEVTGEIYDPDDDDDDPDVIQEFSLKEKSGSIWYMDEFIPHFAGPITLKAVNNSGENEHDGELDLESGYATLSYSPEGVTAGIGLENITVELMGMDANGNYLPDGTKLYLNIDDAAGTDTDPAEGDSVTIDEDGMAEFEIECVGDEKGKINFTFWDEFDEDYQGNLTEGYFSIMYPTFIVDPATIYIGMANQITITAYDYNNNPIDGVNITLLPSSEGVIPSQPDPVETDATGQVVLSVQPVASGKLNVTIARDLEYVDGQLEWDNTVVTDTVVTATSLKPLEIELSKSPIFQGETLTVTVKSGVNTVSGATVKFGQETKTTDTSGEADFTVPDPGVESATYKVRASKEGYNPATEDITVIKKFQITITGPAGDISAGQEVTITILAKGSALAGATITIDGQTYTSNENGKVTLTVPSTEGTYTITATFEQYTDGTLTITVAAGGIPGFEVLTLIAALGVAFIVLKRRKH